MSDRQSVPHDEAPDLSHMTTPELVMLMGECGQSPEPSDQAFAKACRDEIARRKPQRATASPYDPNPNAPKEYPGE